VLFKINNAEKKQFYSHFPTHVICDCVITITCHHDHVSAVTSGYLFRSVIFKYVAQCFNSRVWQTGN